MSLPPRRRRIRIVKSGLPSDQPDLWPGDELWADDFTLLGVVNLKGEFVPNLTHTAAVN